MNDQLDAPISSGSSAALTPLRGPAAPVAAAAAPSARGWWLALAVVGALGIASLVLAWKADQRGASLEQELVRRQQDSAGQATEARMLAKQAQEGMTENAAKIALLDARVAEVAVQRGQLEDLIQSLSRSRDENVLSDVEAALRVALQQTAITGSAEPLVAALKQSDERLARYSQPRLEGVRRAIARDLDRVRAVSVTDISSLGIKLDEATRMVDDLPLLAVADARSDAVKDNAKAAPAGRAASASTNVNANPSTSPSASPGASGSASAPASGIALLTGDWASKIGGAWDALGERVWGETKSLLRVTRIEHPDAMLLAPEQSYFVRENLKLRLLNARLALLGRQFDTAQSDLQVAQLTLDRYFDRTSKRTVLVRELVRQVAGQARQVGVPRPDDTLAALTAASAGR